MGLDKEVAQSEEDDVETEAKEGDATAKRA